MSDNFLDSLHVSNKPQKKPYFGIVYSRPGLGKTGFCQHAPSPFYIAFDRNSNWVNANAFRKDGRLILPNSLEQADAMIKKVMSREFINQHDIKTVVIDGITFYQNWIEQDIIAKHPTFTRGKDEHQTQYIEDLGYDGRGLAMPYWDRLIKAIDRFNSAGLNVILVGHEITVNETNKEGISYKIKTINLMKYGMHDVPSKLMQAADWVFRIRQEVDIVTVGAGKWKKTLAEGGENDVFNISIQTRQENDSFAKINGIGMDAFPSIISLNRGNENERNETYKKVFEMLEGNF